MRKRKYSKNAFSIFICSQLKYTEICQQYLFYEIANIAKLTIITNQTLPGWIINSNNINCKFVLVSNGISIHQNN